MQNSSMQMTSSGRFQTVLRLLIVGIACSLFSAYAVEWSPGYKYNMRGEIVRDAKGNCVRTSQWSRETAVEECDPEVVKQVAQDVPVREKLARVTEVEAQVDTTVLEAGDEFAFNKADLSEAAKRMLAAVVDGYKDVYIHQVNIVGYTDKIGNEEYNLNLSQRRAEAVKEELVALGIPQERIKVSAKGSADPLVTCDNVVGKEALIACLAPNRRTEVSFIIPTVSTAAAAEFVERRRREAITGKDISISEEVMDPSIITQGFNDAMKIAGDGCSKEIAAFCANVPLGDNRVLNCLNAHRDQMSAGCIQAIAKAEATVEEALGNANFFGAQCGPDLERRCPNIEPGEGRLVVCLKDKITRVTKRCVDAMLQLSLIDQAFLNEAIRAQEEIREQGQQ
jgi:OOP family OmpA-OmpF porin